MCLIISLRVYQVVGVQQEMWPLPGLYLLEMLIAVVFGALDVWPVDADRSWRSMLAWIVVGLLLGFVVMGAWSIGFLYMPVAVLLLAAVLVADRRRHQSMRRHVGLCALGGLAQVLMMLGVIRLMYPAAVF
jgi:hypothetical protein